MIDGLAREWYLFKEYEDGSKSMLLWYPDHGSAVTFSGLIPPVFDTRIVVVSVGVVGEEGLDYLYHVEFFCTRPDSSFLFEV